MIIQVNIQNNIALPIVLNSNRATGQPIPPNGALQATFSAQPDADGVIVLELYIDPAN